VKKDDVMAAIAAIEAYQAKPGSEAASAFVAAMTKVPGVWIVVGGRRYRVTNVSREGTCDFEELAE
jgi:hypothetical protein